MAVYRYPQNDFDNPDVLLGLLGSFWANTYEGNGLLEDLTSVTGQLAQQTYVQLMELINSVSRYTVPLYHQDNWYALTIRQSQLNADADRIASYTDPATFEYRTPSDIDYGIPQAPGQYFTVAKPADLVQVRAIFNRLVEPSVELCEGIDYWFTPTQIAFREDPFLNPKIAKREWLNDRGEVVDTELVLWLYRGQWDWSYVYEQFGYALRLRLQTSEGYKQFINAIFDAFTTGTAIRHQQLALSAAFGVPLAIETTETVEAIRDDNHHRNIITDQHVYKFPLGTQAIVTPGQVIKAGDPLTDLLQVFELNRGEPLDIAALSVGPGVLALGYYSDLTFLNTEVPLIVETDAQGYTRVSWELGGFPYDVEKFWDDVHASGVAKNQTLAMLLDQRPEPEGQPTAAALPATINPLHFLTQNLLRNNAAVVKVKPGSQLGRRLAFVPVEQLRKIQPPHSLLIFVVELGYHDNPVIMEAAGTELQPGYSETVGGFPCMVAADAIAPDTFITEQIRTTVIGGRCV
jgi:hypothetical protein